MKKNVLVLFALLFISLSFTSCSSDSSEATTSNSTTTETAKSYNHTQTEVQLLDLINDYRVGKGLNPLQIIEHISYKSSEHNTYMIETNSVNHDGFDDRKTNLQHVLGAYKVGENVAYGFSTPQAALTAWINSDGHRANLEGDYSHFGLSISQDANGRFYYTNMFIKK